MPNLFLYIAKEQRNFTHLRVICTFNDGIDGERGRLPKFTSAYALERALQGAGVQEHELQAKRNRRLGE